MYSNNNNHTGIYKIVNLVNNKFYIGSCLKSKSRKQIHFRKLNNGIHPNAHLQNSWNKYGKENFIFEIIEIIEDKSKLIEREQFYIDNLKPEYNIRKIAHNNTGIKFSQEVKEKMSKNRKGNKNGFYGKKHSIESIEEMKNSRLKSGVTEQNKIRLLEINKNKRVYKEEDVLKIFDLNNSGFSFSELVYLGLGTKSQISNLLYGSNRYKEIKKEYNLKRNINV